MRFVPVLLLTLVVGATAVPASAKKKACKSPNVKLGKLCVKQTFKNAKGSITVRAVHDFRTRSVVYYAAVALTDPVSLTCSDGSPSAAPPQQLTGQALLKGSKFALTVTNGDKTTSIKGAYKAKKKAVVDSFKVSYPAAGGATCSAEATNVVIKG